MATVNIQFKPEFELKLKRLRIKTKLLRNIKAFIEVRQSYTRGSLHLVKAKGPLATHTVMDSAKILNMEPTWNKFIHTAFNWEDSAEGYWFWSDIANK